MTPGKRVVCIDDSIRPEMIEWQRQFCPNWVRKNAEYTVREFDDNGGVVDGILLEELRNKPVLCIPFGRVLEPRFATWRFREVEKKETKVEIETSELIYF